VLDALLLYDPSERFDDFLGVMQVEVLDVPLIEPATSLPGPSGAF